MGQGVTIYFLVSDISSRLPFAGAHVLLGPQDGWNIPRRYHLELLTPQLGV